jgi:hypothetical protein
MSYLLDEIHLIWFTICLFHHLVILFILITTIVYYFKIKIFELVLSFLSVLLFLLPPLSGIFNLCKINLFIKILNII